MNEITPKTPLYLSLYLSLKNKILTGVYPAGSKLPSEQEIAKEHGVSRITSKRALDQLVTDGYIQRFAGKGTFVQSTVQTEEPAYPQPVQKPKLIGLLMNDLPVHFGLDILLGVEKACAKAGYSLVLKLSNGNSDREKECIEELLAAGVSGLILLCTYSEMYNPIILKLSLSSFPMVFLDHALPGLPIPCIRTDHAGAAEEITELLLQNNPGNLAVSMAGDTPRASSVIDRVQGYTKSCIRYRAECADNIIPLLDEENPFDESSPERAVNLRRVQEFLNARPEITTVLALSMRVARVYHHALRDHLIHLDTLASFDVLEPVNTLPCRYICVKQNQQSIGSAACDQLISLMDGKSVEQTTIIPHSIIELPYTNRPEGSANS